MRHRIAAAVLALGIAVATAAAAAPAGMAGAMHYHGRTVVTAKADRPPPTYFHG